MKLSRKPHHNTHGAYLYDLRIVTEPDGCSYVYDSMSGLRGPKKHSRKAAVLAFWQRGFIK